MKLQIIGSINHLESEHQSEMKQAGIELGKLIAENSIEVILSSLKNTTIDYHIIEGMNSITGKHKITLFCPEEFTHPKNFAEYDNIDFVVKRYNGPWSISHIYGLKHTDIAILIGGSPNLSLTAGYSSFPLEVPLICLPYFNGAGKTLWINTKESYLNKYLTESEITILQEKWNDKTARTIVDAARKLHKKKPYKKVKLIPQTVLFSFILGLVVLWVLIFNKVVLTNIENRLLFFLLLGISSFIGTGLRTSIFLGKKQDDSYKFHNFLNDLTTGLVIAFGFALIYFVSSLILTGQYLSLKEEVDFTRVAITLSLIGIGTSFLIENAIDKFKSRIIQMVSGE